MLSAGSRVALVSKRKGVAIAANYLKTAVCGLVGYWIFSYLEFLHLSFQEWGIE